MIREEAELEVARYIAWNRWMSADKLAIHILDALDWDTLVDKAWRYDELG